MRELLSSELMMLLLTVGAFLLGKLIFRKTKMALFNPLLIAALLIIPTLLLLDISYEQYHKSTQFIRFFLSPTVVLLGFLLYEEVESIRANLKNILIAITTGSFVTMGTILLIGKLMGAENEIILSLLPKSVTMPIALSLSGQSGGVEAITAVSVVITGIFGNMIGVTLLKLFKITDKIAAGLAFGASSHAIGTAKALECGALEGAMSGLAIGVTGVITALMMPLFQQLLAWM